MTNKCNNCVHSKVCMHKQRYQENYMILENKFKNDEVFFIDLDCKIYEFSNLINIKELKLDISPFQILVPCEECPIYEEIKKGKTVINDACTFCSKNPIRIGD